MDRSTFFDLACENSEEKDFTGNHRDVRASSSEKIQIRRGSDDIHGSYTVFFTEPIWEMGEKKFFEVREILSEELGRFLSEALREDVGTEKILLVAGLGNPKMTADALGSEVVDRIEITRKTEKNNSSLLSAGGISPGGGVGNSQKSLSKKTLGVPVISIGVPTVVRSSVIIREAMDAFGLSLTDKEKDSLTRDSFFMMPKESDLLLERAALLLASAIRQACDFSC